MTPEYSQSSSGSLHSHKLISTLWFKFSFKKSQPMIHVLDLFCSCIWKYFLLAFKLEQFQLNVLNIHRCFRVWRWCTVHEERVWSWWWSVLYSSPAYHSVSCYQEESHLACLQTTKPGWILHGVTWICFHGVRLPHVNMFPWFLISLCESAPVDLHSCFQLDSPVFSSITGIAKNVGINTVAIEDDKWECSWQVGWKT